MKLDVAEPVWLLCKIWMDTYYHLEQLLGSATAISDWFTKTYLFWLALIRWRRRERTKEEKRSYCIPELIIHTRLTSGEEPCRA